VPLLDLHSSLHFLTDYFHVHLPTVYSCTELLTGNSLLQQLTVDACMQPQMDGFHVQFLTVESGMHQTTVDSCMQPQTDGFQV